MGFLQDLGYLRIDLTSAKSIYFNKQSLNAIFRLVILILKVLTLL
eukprot:gene22237-16670_t